MSSELSNNNNSRSNWTAYLWEASSGKLGITLKLLYLAGLIGVVAGLGAVVFEIMSQTVKHFVLDFLVGYHPSKPGGETELFRHGSNVLHPWLLILLPVAGGFLSGLLVYLFAPEAAGHGTDAAIEAYHRKDGYIRPQVPIVKLFASVITMGTGGSGGREGPIAQIGAGFGSLFARTLHLTRKECRVLMIAGMGAGIGAIFRAPLAGALFAAEVLYRDPEFEAEVIVPAGVGSTIAYAVFGYFFGLRPLFDPPDVGFFDPLELLPYLALAVFMTLLATFYVRFFYMVHDAFTKHKMHPLAKPMVGAFITGVIGLGIYTLAVNFIPEHALESLSVMSYGYGILQDFLVEENFRDQEAYTLAALFLTVAIGKVLTTSFTIGSGGSGGVFGPAMVIGGCAGGAFGILMNRWFPGLVTEPASYMVVGMAGFFTAAAKTPFSTLIMVSEVTGNYGLLPPALLVCLVAYLLSPEDLSLYAAQVTSHLRSPAHRGEYVKTVLANVTVDRFLKPDQKPLTIRLHSPLSSVVHELDGSHSLVLPVVNEDDVFLGMVCLEEVHLALHSLASQQMILAADLMRTDVIPLYPGDTLYRAMELFGRNELRALPIVKSDRGVERVVGIVRRSDVQTEYLKHVHGERRGDESHG
ncbi:H(+)/Cl(-) exchange transporter ClcA [Planctomycetes bacterium Pan216]|uniref:H(+)/Cl(-) exchange transporter ClcA n=1 Tax=Kolteria novifilia TaxID=2527975 RepID=A0A518B976_9BACT|nr:H(+)/Cl(-) exchange transporter ClcA [Planctomycetes bacterium Pan216]